jgi:hypothetical protein
MAAVLRSSPLSWLGLHFDQLSLFRPCFLDFYEVIMLPSGVKQQPPQGLPFPILGVFNPLVVGFLEQPEPAAHDPGQEYQLRLIPPMAVF